MAPEPDEGAKIKEEGMMYVYILKCSDGSYYTGVTGSLEQRIERHKRGLFKECYTWDKRPVKLVFTKEFISNNEAIAFEKRVKGWSRAKKEALISGDIDRLKQLSRGKTNASSSSASNSEG
jgi:putative endonuclease